MRKNKIITAIKTGLLPVLYIVSTAYADELQGAKLFQNNCARCHASPAGIKADPANIPAILKSGSIRRHRFSLSDDDINTITAYLSAQNKGMTQ
jgi:mono/diheme cytochrome c family protein